MELINRVNGNGTPYTSELPKIVIVTEFFNEGALEHVKENTGLAFVKGFHNYTAQPDSSNQIASLLMTYNFKTRYYDNATFKNELHLKYDHHIGYQIDSVCFDCLEHNNVHTGQLKPTDRLAC